MGGTVGAPHDREVQPRALGSTPTFTPGVSYTTAQEEHWPRIHVAYDCKTLDGSALSNDIGRDQMVFGWQGDSPDVETKSLGNLMFTKGLTALNLYLRTAEGRSRYNTRSSARLQRDWKFLGIQEGASEKERSHINFHVGGRARTPDVWLWNGEVRHDGEYLWIVAMLKRDAKAAEAMSIMSRPVAGETVDEVRRRLALVPPQGAFSDAEYKKMDDIERALVPDEISPLELGEYWELVPMVTPTRSPPSARHYACHAYTGHCQYIGIATQILEGDANARPMNAHLALTAIQPQDRSDQALKCLLALPKIEVFVAQM